MKTSAFPRFLPVLSLGGLLLAAPSARAQFSLFNANFNNSPTGAVTSLTQLNSGTNQGSWEILTPAGAATLAGGISGNGTFGEDRAAAFAHSSAIPNMTLLAAVNTATPTVFTSPDNTRITDSGGGTRVIARLASPADLSTSPVIDLDYSAFGNSNSGAFKYGFIRGLDAAGNELFECLYTSGSAATTRRFFMRGPTDNETTWTSATVGTPEGIRLGGDLATAYNATVVSTGPTAAQWLGINIQLSTTGVIYALDTNNDGTPEFTSDPQPLNSTATSLDRLEFTIRSSNVDTQNKGYWLNNVSVTANIPDTDSDGLPDAWETANLTNPNVNDAAADPDLDTLTNLQEYLLGTNPQLADTDADGLSDKVETNTGLWVSATDTGTNPLAPDTDNDGLSDSIETNTGNFVSAANPGTNPHKPDSDDDLWNDAVEIANATNPNQATSPGGANPPAFGISFGSARGAALNLPFPATAYAGHPDAVQRNWNRTIPLSAATTGSTLDIATPNAGTLTDSAGASLITQLNFTMSGAWSIAHSPGTPFGRLFNGYLDAATPGNTVTINLTAIPYPRYDVYVYLGSDTNARTGLISSTSAGFGYSYTSGNNPATAGGIPTGTFTRSTDTATSYPSANFVLFTGQTSPDFDLLYTRGNNNGGIYGLQIVARPDTDNDGMSDFYESANGLNPGVNDATLDLDNDGSTNLNEHNLGTLPNNPDTDGDGVPDGPETNTGNWNSPADRGTNPHRPDTDGDGLRDGVETNTGIFTNASSTGSNPHKSDTDDDLWTDNLEAANSTDPSNSESPGGPNPEAIGIIFGSGRGEGASLPLPDTAYLGLPAVSQKQWNLTEPATGNLASGSNASIVLPNAGTLTNSRGTTTTATISYTMGNTWSALHSRGTPFGRLFSSHLNANAAPINIELADIPYPSYDVYVYFACDINGRQATVGSTTAGLTYSLTTGTMAANGGGIATGTFIPTTDTAGGNPVANYCVFPGRTTPTFNINYTRGGANNSGIAAIQIVRSTASPFQSWQQQKFAADASNPLIAGPDADPDADGVVNLLEYALGTEPKTPAPLNLNFTSTGGIVSIRYTPNAAATDITLTPQWSENLTTWFSTGITITGTTEKTASIPQGPEVKKFLRLKVTLP